MDLDAAELEGCPRLLTRCQAVEQLRRDTGQIKSSLSLNNPYCRALMPENGKADSDGTRCWGSWLGGNVTGEGSVLC